MDELEDAINDLRNILYDLQNSKSEHLTHERRSPTKNWAWCRIDELVEATPKKPGTTTWMWASYR